MFARIFAKLFFEEQTKISLHHTYIIIISHDSFTCDFVKMI